MDFDVPYEDEGYLGSRDGPGVLKIPPEGYFDCIRFVRASFKPKRSGNGSRLTDYLKACRHSRLWVPTMLEAAMGAVRSTAGCSV
jgi:hypothetical protein